MTMSFWLISLLSSVTIVLKEW